MSSHGQTDIVLVSCVKSKRAEPCPAGELYKSPLFKKMMAYAAILKPREIFILSAEYGLLRPTTLVKPYEKTLNEMSPTERKYWTERVLVSLQQHADLQNDHFVLLAGAHYRNGLLPHIKHYSIPMEQMTFGKQLQWLKAQIQ